MTKKKLLIALAVVVGVALCTANFLLYQQQAQAAALGSARDSAAEAANVRVPQLLSYDYRTLDHDLEAARSGTTGTFHDEFATLTTKVVEPAAKDQQIVTKTTVTGSSVVSAQPQQVVLLVFLNQVTRTKADKESRVDGARVRVTLARAGDQWLVSALTPV